MNFFFVTLAGLASSSNPVLIAGLRQSGAGVEAFEADRRGIAGFLQCWKAYRRSGGEADVVIVGYDMPLLVCWMRLISRKFIVYNALCSVYERLILSRGLASPISPKAVWYWLQDFFACRCADVVMLESDHQRQFFKKVFLLRGQKSVRFWTGVDEQKFYQELNCKKNDTFTAVFRGRFLPEAGVGYLIQAAKILEGEPIKILLLGNGQELPGVLSLIRDLHPTNLELRTEFLADEELREILSRCHLGFGQLSDHSRLDRTIPHKAYESLAMGLPYLTARNDGILELLEEGSTCLACTPADPADLAAQIRWAATHPAELAQIAQAGHQLYVKTLRPVILATGLLEGLRMKGVRVQRTRFK